MRNPFMVDALTVVRELALRAVLLVIVACFPLRADATSPVPVNETDATLRAELVVNVACLEASVVDISTPAR